MLAGRSSKFRSNAPPRVLVAGLGNICLSDDGFGVEVARTLVARQPWPDYVRIADFGVRGSDLATEASGPWVPKQCVTIRECPTCAHETRDLWSR